PPGRLRPHAPLPRPPCRTRARERARRRRGDGIRAGGPGRRGRERRRPPALRSRWHAPPRAASRTELLEPFSRFLQDLVGLRKAEPDLRAPELGVSIEGRSRDARHAEVLDE